MRLALTILFLLAIFIGVGWPAAHAVVQHASATAPRAQVQLSAAMAGLFTGGAATLIAGITILWLGKKRSE